MAELWRSSIGRSFNEAGGFLPRKPRLALQPMRNLEELLQ